MSCFKLWRVVCIYNRVLKHTEGTHTHTLLLCQGSYCGGGDLFPNTRAHNYLHFVTCFDFVLWHKIWEKCVCFVCEKEGGRKKRFFCLCVCVLACFCVCKTTHCSSSLTTHWHFVSLPPHVQHNRILKSSFFFLTHAHPPALCSTYKSDC